MVLPLIITHLQKLAYIILMGLKINRRVITDQEKISQIVLCWFSQKQITDVFKLYFLATRQVYFTEVQKLIHLNGILGKHYK